MERKLRMPDIESSRSARILADRFIQRWDIHAIQLNDGRYICIKKPLRPGQITQHLKGFITLGVYVLNGESETTLTVIDADSSKQYNQLILLANKLSTGGIPSYIESSRRGGHLWFFHAEAISGERSKTFGEELLAEHHLEPMEVFPKQEELGNGPGSLIRLPYGVHRKSGHVYPFVKREDAKPMANTIHGQIDMLSKVNTVTKAMVEEYTAYALPNHGNDRENHSENVWERIRETTSAVDFIGHYIELTPTATGSVGYCPFHEDKVKSFGVHRKGNFWHCFAGCGGGSIIDFWMKWKGLELGEAVHDLQNILEVS